MPLITKIFNVNPMTIKNINSYIKSLNAVTSAEFANDNMGKLYVLIKGVKYNEPKL